MIPRAEASRGSLRRRRFRQGLLFHREGRFEIHLRRLHAFMPEPQRDDGAVHALAPLLFQDHDPAGAEAVRRSVVAPAERSPAAHRKAATQHTDDGLPVHSLETLLEDLETLTRNRMRFGRATFEQIASPTPPQERAFELLDVPWRA